MSRLDQANAAFKRFWKDYRFAYDKAMRPAVKFAFLEGAASAIWPDSRNEIRRCATCDRPRITLRPDSNRTTRIYCSDACRVKAYRKRKANA